MLYHVRIHTDKQVSKTRILNNSKNFICIILFVENVERIYYKFYCHFKKMEQNYLVLRY